MPNIWLPLVAGVNLAVALVVALPAFARRPHLAGRLLLAAVPALWAVGIFAVFLYFQAAVPPSPVEIDPDGSVIVVKHGNVDWIAWEDQVDMAHRLALWITLVTLLGLVLLGVTRAIWAGGGGTGAPRHERRQPLPSRRSHPHPSAASRCTATPAMTRATPATSAGAGICRSTTTPMATAEAGSRESSSANVARGRRAIAS